MVHVDALSCLPWRAGPSTQRVLARRQAGWVHARRPRHEEAPRPAGPVTLESGRTSTTRLGVRHGLPVGVQIPARYGSVVSAFSSPRHRRRLTSARAVTMDTTRPTISAHHEQPKPDIVYMSESGRAGRVANGVANAMDERDARCTARSARRPPTAFRHGSARDGFPYSMLVAIIIRVGPDGLNTHVDEYFDRVLDPLHKQEPSRR